MGRFRTALATISVGALLATSQSVVAQGAPPVNGAVAGATPAGTGSTGITGTTGTTGSTGSTGTTGGKPGTGTKPPAKEKPAKPDKPSGKKDKPKKPGKKNTNGNQTVDPARPSPEPPKEVVPPAKEPLHVQIAPPAGIAPTVPGDSSPIQACDGSAGPPRNLIPLYIAASNKYGLGELGPQTLAAINRIETDFGRLNKVTSSAGAVGWMQFMPATWDAYGVDADGDGKADPYNPKDAIHSAANYLSAAGAPENWYDAIWAYNHADWYVKDIQDHAACYGSLDREETAEKDLVTFTCEASEARALEIPNYYMRGFEEAASRYELGRRGVWILASVARLESDYGRGMTAKQLVKHGPMGLTEKEWKSYGVDGDGDGMVRRDEPWDGIATFARMLWSNPTLEAGLFAHNHASWYVEAATSDADRIAGKCKTAKAEWKIAYPRATVNATEINWANLQVMNPTAASDIQNGLIDRRVINLLAILTQKYSLQISALRSDHSMMTASGNISNHYGGRALDIAAVNGVPCTDQSASSPCTEVGLLLASLPDGVRPTELIYGWDLDGPGPAFAMADHANHIHAGFGL